jgi:hypothetical protein
MAVMLGGLVEGVLEGVLEGLTFQILRSVVSGPVARFRGVVVSVSLIFLRA